MDKTPVIVITLVVLTLIYLDNAGRLPAAMAVIQGGVPSAAPGTGGIKLPPFVAPIGPAGGGDTNPAHHYPGDPSDPVKPL
jgi:hypothetical protein